MSKRFILAVLTLSILCTPLLRSETQVLISASKNLAFVGDVISLKIVVKTDRQADGIRAKIAASEFDVVSQADLPLQHHDNESVFEQDVEIAYFRTGDFEIGPFTIEVVSGEEVLETKETNSIPIKIKSVLTEEDKDIVDLKGPIEVKGNPLYVLKYVMGFVALLLLAIFLVVYFKRRKRPAQEKAQPLLSPIGELEARVKELMAMRLPEKGMLKEFFLRLTEIYKRFLNRQYGFNAEDLTTYETLLHLDSNETERAIVDGVGYVLNTADLVKFAKFIPGERVMGDVHAKISTLVDSIRRREQDALNVKKENHVTVGK